jgi:hypothetical protein
MQGPSTFYILHLHFLGSCGEWLGTGLQSRLQRDESTRDL